MCGRLAQYSSGDEIAAAFGLPAPPAGLSPRYNVAPTQQVLAVLPDTGQGRTLANLRWGLVPSWSKDPSVGHRLINARADTVADKPSFRTAFRRHRCLVVATGFFEWQAVGKQKQPYLFTLRSRGPFGFAGLWERWQQGAEEIVSCAIITTGANDLVRPVHDRMPVILPPERYAEWLDPEIQDRERLLPLLLPYPAGEMSASPVSTRVNSPRNDDSGCIESVA